ncbi:transposase [Pantoea sp. DY-15]|uniref:transposase n=1 Tax=Pantoea sp. DY-15 TaxID=2871489 RepID=UPI0021073C1F|nr:transposase [Pantoea sp. DY-15]
MSGRTSTPEVKRECAELVLDHGYTTQQTCKTIYVGPTAIHHWVRQLLAEPGLTISPSATPLTLDQQQIRQLE